VDRHRAGTVLQNQQVVLRIDEGDDSLESRRNSQISDALDRGETLTNVSYRLGRREFGPVRCVTPGHPLNGAEKHKKQSDAHSWLRLTIRSLS
jgi:hypothetical protein